MVLTVDRIVITIA